MSAATSNKSCAISSRSPYANAETKRKESRQSPKGRRRPRARRAGRRQCQRVDQGDFRKKLRTGELNDKEIEIETQAAGGGMPLFDVPGYARRPDGRISIGDIFGKLGGSRTKTRRVTVHDSDDIPDQRGIRQTARYRSAHQEAIKAEKEQRHRLSR